MKNKVDNSWCYKVNTINDYMLRNQIFLSSTCILEGGFGGTGIELRV
jgi:hypothetical protein